MQPKMTEDDAQLIKVKSLSKPLSQASNVSLAASTSLNDRGRFGAGKMGTGLNNPAGS